MNRAVFPAALLQMPFFNLNTDNAINFRFIRAVIGHEMPHRFDDQGRKFNFKGNIIDWQTKEDREEYKKIVMQWLNRLTTLKCIGRKSKVD